MIEQVAQDDRRPQSPWSQEIGLREAVFSGDRRLWGAAPLLVPGTVLVAFLLATGRWGSYVGLPAHRIYVTDVLVLVTVAWVALRRFPLVLDRRTSLRGLASVLALLAIAVGRFAVGDDHTLTATRDFAPYGYAVVCLAALFASPAARRRSAVVIGFALVVHAAWVTLSVVVGGLVARMPVLGGAVNVFAVRRDFDGAVLALLAALGLHQVLTSRVRSWRLVAALFVVWPAAVVLQLANRAALLALVVALALTVCVDLQGLRRLTGPRALAGAALLLAIGAILLPHTAAYERLSGDPKYAANAAASTQHARAAAWQDVLDYVDDSPRRVLVGTGFGPDFVWISGAALRLQGPENVGVRAPHDYVINTYARLGVVGLAGLAWVLVAGFVAGGRLVFGRRPSLAELTCLAICATLLTASLVGVILESPFGAVPFFWSLGLVLTARAATTAEPAVGSAVKRCG